MPPCISQLEGGLVQVAIEVEDRAPRSAITSNTYSFTCHFIFHHLSTISPFVTLLLTVPS